MKREAENEEKINEIARGVMGKSFEDRLLDKGLNVTVSVYGPKHTIMKLKWIGVSKVLAHQMAKNGDFFEELRRNGFKKFIITDGYNEEWYWSL